MISSMLPYAFFFMPEAFVAIHPPNVENSFESYTQIHVLLNHHLKPF